MVTEGVVDGLAPILAGRGLRPVRAEVISVGHKNQTWRVHTAAGSYFVRRYSFATCEEAEFELSAIEYLAERGFPTPRCLRDHRGRLVDEIDGAPGAVFEHAIGHQLADLDRAGDEMGLGRQAARLAGRLHNLTRGVTFAGNRSSRRDPVQTIRFFLTHPMLRLPVLHPLTDVLEELAATVATLQGRLPGGLVHNDISAHNLMVDPAGRVTALIDFDDCIVSTLLFDLGRICEVWAADNHGQVNHHALHILIDDYSSVRALSADEQKHALLFVAAYAAGTGLGVLYNRWRAQQTITGPTDSRSMCIASALFTDLRSS